MNSIVWQFLIPVIFLFYAFKLYLGRPGMNDSFCFPTRRAKESEEIWNYVQRCAGAVCFFAAIVLAITAYVFLVVFRESNAAYWVQIAIELVCVFSIVPVVNALTDRKFPPKKRKRK